MFLVDLPVEVLQQIVGHLPTASSILNLGLTNHKIHDIISEDDYSIFRTFVQRAFPTIATPPMWRDAAQCLTSRSRAWDRRAFIARECCPPPDDLDWANDGPISYTTGYQPGIDSYETWHGQSWSARKEVLAWGAAGRLRLRTTKDGVASWSSWRVPEDHRQELDILDVRLLLPDQHENLDGESIILRRANGEVVKVDSSSKANEITQRSRYLTGSANPNCIDVSKSANPLLAICDAQSVQLFPVRNSHTFVKSSDTIPVQGVTKGQQRKRVAKFLSDTSLAVASQFLQGRDQAPINIFDITPTGLSISPLIHSVCASTSGRHNANVIAPLDHISYTTSSRPGQLFLSGWTDGCTRLHDLRLPDKLVATYTDVVDDGQILSLVPIGHERFIVGSHQNGCVKTFDLRMSGARAYSYTNHLQPGALRQAPRSSATMTTTTTKSTQYDPATQTFHTSDVQRDINIFLTPMVSYRDRLWEPLARQPNRRAERYRGSIYSLSSPSPSSPTIYAGIANHVIRLDFLSTDDIRNGSPAVSMADPTLSSHSGGGGGGGVGKMHQNPNHNHNNHHIMNLSCYERPRKGHESTDPILLRKQTPLAISSTRRDSTGSHSHSKARRDSKSQQQRDANLSGIVQAGDGWDERWRLEVYDRASHGRNSNWARG